MENKQDPRYDAHCRDLKQPPSANVPFVLRLQIPQEGETHFRDALLGDIVVQNRQLDDLIILRSDGTPTYHFSVVVDDIDMNITHIIRGNDHVSNTPRQIHIFHALKASIPSYTHLPMVLGEDGQRLSKRHGALGVMTYRDVGYLAEAMCNYLLRLGWSCGDRELFTLKEACDLFNLDHLQKSSAHFSPDKLQWFNHQHLKQISDSQLRDLAVPYFKQAGIDPDRCQPPLAEMIPVQRNRSQTLQAIATNSLYFYLEDIQYNPEAKEQYITPESLALLSEVQQQLNALEDWKKETIKQVLHGIMQTRNLKLPQIALPLRVALTGDTSSPSIDLTIYLMGKERTNRRIQAILSA